MWSKNSLQKIFFVIITLADMYLEQTKILTYTVLAFLIAIWWAPSLIRLLVWLKFWKKTNRKINMSGEAIGDKTLQKFYAQDESKLKVPRGGGVLIWVTTLFFAIFFWILLKIDDQNQIFQYLNFIDRKQTFIPIGTLFFGSILGFIDDALSTLESGGNYSAGGLKLSQRVGIIATLSLAIGYWFWDRVKITRLDFFAYRIDLSNLWGLNLAWLIIPITVITLLALWGSSVIDGLDGLAGGVFIPIYLCFAGIAYSRGLFDITTLLMVMVGCMGAFLWYNISPARFYMGDSGSTGILLTLGVVAILTNAIYLLPIAGIMLLLTLLSNVIQITSKRLLGRKVFLAAPIHHHFEALGLTKNQIVLRYWIISIIMSALALAIGLVVR